MILMSLAIKLVFTVGFLFKPFMQKSGITVGVQLENLQYLGKNYFSRLNKIISVEAKPLHSVNLRNIYSGLYVYYTGIGENRLRVVFVRPIIDVTVLRDHTIIWGTTEDKLSIYFENIIFDFDLFNRDTLIQNFEVNVEKITTETTYIPDSVLDFFGTPKLNEFFKQSKWRQQLNSELHNFLSKEMLIKLSDSSKVNLSSVPNLYMIDTNKTMTAINQGNGTSNLMLMYPVDGTFFMNENLNTINTQESKPIVLPESHLLKNVSLYLSDYSLDGLIRSQLEGSGGISNKIEESGFTVQIDWIKSRPLTSSIHKNEAIDVALWFRVDLGFMGIRNGVDAEVKALVGAKLVGNSIKLEIINIDFNAGLFTDLIKIKFLNLSGRINSAVANALKSSVHLPSIDLGFVERAVENKRVGIRNSTLVFLENYLQLGYDSIQLKRAN